MKTIKVKPIDPIRIQLNDKTYTCTFSMMGMAYMQEELGKLPCKLNEISPARMTALILYSGIRPNEPEFTIEEANALAVQMGPSHYSDIIGAYNEAIYGSMDKMGQNELKKAVAQYLLNAKK